MNRVQFRGDACEKTRRYMDAYISNELLVETTQDVLQHLDSCPECASELDARTRLRARLKSAVQSQAMPPELPARVRERIRRHQSSAWFASGWFASGWFAREWRRYAMAAAAVLVICAAGWFRLSHTPFPRLDDRAAQASYIQKISATAGQVFRPGIADHIHCAIFRRYPRNPPTIQELETSLGDTYQGLLPLVAPVVPEGYRVVLGHQCSFNGRHFVHLTMRNGSDVISLVITRKNEGESFHALSPSISTAGGPVYQTASGPYQVAGFESAHYLAFVVSNLKAKTNLQIAAALAPSVRQLLS